MTIKIAALILSQAIVALAQIPNREAVQRKLESTYALTQPIADNTGIVAAGAILILKKNEIVMNASSSVAPSQNIYREGRLSQNALGRTIHSLHNLGMTTTSNNTRTFVRGEKMWVTRIDVREDGPVFSLLSDPYGDVRYRAVLRFTFEKGTIASIDEVENTIAQVFQIQPGEEPPSRANAEPPPRTFGRQAPTSSFVETPAVIPVPPPPPSDAVPAPAKTISAGQTIEQVKAIFGQPRSIVELGRKQIFVYEALKVTFTDGKVSDVQ